MRGQRLRLLLLPRLWVFYVWGSGGFGFRFAALHVCACALIGLHFPYLTTAQYLFQYMISFLLRSRYSFIFKGTKSLLICGYVPLCSLRRVLWVLFMLLGNGLLPAHAVVLAHRALTSNTMFYFQTETFQLVPVVVESVSCLSCLFHCHVWFHLFHVSTCFEYSCSETKLHICH